MNWRRCIQIVVTFGVVTLLVAYVQMVRQRASYFAAGSDSSGYMNAARLIANGALSQPVPRLGSLAPPQWDYLWQQPLGYQVDRQSGTMTPTYPVGLPLHYAAASLFVGLDFAPVLANVALAIAAAVLMILLGRAMGLPWRWSGFGAAILWGCPMFIIMDLQPMSDVPALVWVLAAMVFAQWARAREGWGLAAGFAFAVAILVRPTDALALVPIAVVLGGRWRAWGVGLLGGLPGAVFQGWYNHRVYGAILATGYGDISATLGFRFVPGNALHFACWLTVLLTPFVVLPALIYFARSKAWHRPRAMLASWIGVIGLFYLGYSFSNGAWWYLRFLLPVFPVIVVAGLLELRDWWNAAGESASRRWTTGAALALILPAELLVARHLDIFDVKQGERSYFVAAQWAREHLPPDAIVIQMQTSGAFTYYTHFALVRWDYLTPENWAELQRTAQASGRRIFASLFEFEETPVLRGVTAGGWQKRAQLQSVSIWEWVPRR